MATRLPDHQKVTEFLAAERTFLAWIRTSIAVISLGFVVAKFGVWLRELAARIDPQLQTHSTGLSLPIGIGMMAFGGCLALLAAWHYRILNAEIERGEMRTNGALVATLAVGVVFLAGLMIAYMLLTAEGL